MLGHSITRIAGWDTHGLPVEIEAEEKLGISGKPEIEKMGIARFNEVCKESVFTYKEEWEAPQRADRVLARLLPTLRHLPHGVHRVGLVDSEGAGESRPPVPRLQVGPVLPSMWHSVVLA